MELIKENIHMLRIKSKATSQMTFDEDYNVPDAKPDIGRMIQSKGKIHLDEVKLGEGNAYMKGNLTVDLLYVADGEEGMVYSMSAQLPINETLFLEGIESGDKMCLNWEIEDLTLHVIHSRKLNIQSIVTFYAVVDELRDVQLPIGVSQDHISVKKKDIPVMSLAVHKKDTLRLKEEITLASNKPDISKVLWNTIEVRGLDIRAGNDELDVKGELFVFVLYAGDEQENPLQWLEHSIPFHGQMECPGCSSEMIPGVDLSVMHQSMEVKPDSDGEERILALDVVMEMNMNIYEEKQYSLLLDMYTPAMNLLPATQEEMMESLLVRNFSKCRVSEKYSVPETRGKILQICHSYGKVKIDRSAVVKDGIFVEGIIQVKILYIISDDQMPFYSMEVMLPFNHTVEAVGVSDSCIYQLRPDLEQLSTTMLDGNEIEVKAVLSLNVLVINRTSYQMITDVDCEEWDSEQLRKMPGIILYIVQPEDTLWDIAKNFYTTVEEVQRLNALENDKISPYQPLLLTKKVEN